MSDKVLYELKELLIETNNEPQLADTILSYLDKCMLCKRYDITKMYYIKQNGYNGSWKRTKDFRVLYLCKCCQVKVMIYHNQGKSGILSSREYWKWVSCDKEI